MSNRPLTPKQQRFVQEYLVDLNATQAAIRAGYSAKTAGMIGFENLTKPEIVQAILAGKQKIAERNEVTQDLVIQGLLHEANFKAKGASHSARVSAWSWLGKHLGILSEKHEFSGPGGKPIAYTDVTDAELDAEIERLKRV